MATLKNSMTVYELYKLFPAIGDYSYKWQEESDSKNISDVLALYGYELLDASIAGEYNDIKGYYDCEITRKKGLKLPEDDNYGWSNHATYRAVRHMDNVQGIYDDTCKMADNYLVESMQNPDADPAIRLADYLIEKYRDREQRTLKDFSELYTNLLDYALSEVNFDEIARAYIETAKKRIK